jgi:ABC-type amino acid transport substrate-binding protein
MQADRPTEFAAAVPIAEDAAPAPDVDDDPPEPDNVVRRLVTQKWQGDLDAMIERRLIGVLPTYSKTNYSVDGGTPRGIIYDAFRSFEDDLKKELKRRNVRVNVMFVPVAHDELIPALLAGRGDTVAAGTLITEERGQGVDFTIPTRTGVSAVVVTGPNQPPLQTRPAPEVLADQNLLEMVNAGIVPAVTTTRSAKCSTDRR